jgi:hypothetical protein
MFTGLQNDALAGFRTVNEILTAGIAITAFSLFFYALSFNLRDRVARSFAVIMLCVVVIFTAEAIGTTVETPASIQFFFRLQWVGLAVLPAAYLHLSDALLVTAGRPSRGRRRLAVRLMYVVSGIFVLLLLAGLLVGGLVPDGKPAPHLQRTLWTDVFTIYYLIAMVWAWLNFIRAYDRMLTRSGRRRMLYLMAGATAPALGSYPFLLFGSGFASQFQLAFWVIATGINIAVGVLIVLMAYAVAFFGVSWPDRIVKTRLMKWYMRGPVTASIALALMTIARRVGFELLGVEYNAAVPVIMVATVLIFEHGITLAAPYWERLLFFGADRDQLILLENMEERLLTQADLRQFLEVILAAVRDHMQAHSAFVAALDNMQLSMLVTAGRPALEPANLSFAPEDINWPGTSQRQEIVWDGYWILPLRLRQRDLDLDQIPPLLGVLAVTRQGEAPLEKDQRQALWLLADRAALALEDRLLQQRVFRSIEDLQPQEEYLQRLRAAGRYDTKSSVLDEELPPEADMPAWVKDALTHYWGGPKLTQSPLLNLNIVQDTAQEDFDGNYANALRAVLRRAVDNVKPEGERRFTSEWILYNILEMKFIEGRKVREVAARLAVSEADLYRKQRVAVEAVAHSIIEMESQHHVEHPPRRSNNNGRESH